MYGVSRMVISIPVTGLHKDPPTTPPVIVTEQAHAQHTKPNVHPD